MKSKIDDLSQRYLLLIKLDAKHLYERISQRKIEYLTVFSIKRTRDHFADIFYNRYRDLRIEELVHCGDETIVALDEFYTLVEEMDWYLDHTEDMPNTVEDKINGQVRQLKKLHQRVELYINAELGYQSDEEMV